MRSSAWCGCSGTPLLQIPSSAKGSGAPRAVPPSSPGSPPAGGWPRRPWSEGHSAAPWGQCRVRDPTEVLRLSSTPKPPAMIIWALLSLLLFTVAHGTPIGDQDEDIQVQENFEAERVMTAYGPLILGSKGMG